MPSIVCRPATGSAILAALAAILSGPATAAVVTVTTPVAGHQFVDPGQDVFVPQFDPALGTLTGVSASLTGQFTPGIVFGVNSPTFPSLPPITFNPTVSFDMSGTHLAPQSATSSNGRAVGTPEAVAITQTYSPNFLPLNPAFPGDLDFYIIASSGTSLPPGTFFTNDLGALEAQVAVTYTYAPAGTPVPEPASLALLGAGLLGLGAVRQRGRRTPSA